VAKQKHASRRRVRAAFALGIACVAIGVGVQVADVPGQSVVTEQGADDNRFTERLRNSFAVGVAATPDFPYKTLGPPQLTFRHHVNGATQGRLSMALQATRPDATGTVLLVLPEKAVVLHDRGRRPGVTVADKGVAAGSMLVDSEGIYVPVGRLVRISLHEVELGQAVGKSKDVGEALRRMGPALARQIEVHFAWPDPLRVRTGIGSSEFTIRYAPDHSVLAAGSGVPLTEHATFAGDLGRVVVEAHVSHRREHIEAVTPEAVNNRRALLKWQLADPTLTQEFTGRIDNRWTRAAVAQGSNLLFLGAGVLLGAAAGAAVERP